jgi:hypothetical protein
MSTKEIKVFTSRKCGDERTHKKSTQNDRKKLQKQNAQVTTSNTMTPQFPEPFFADDPEYMKGFKALLGEFKLKYETFNLNFLVERIKHLKRRENSIMLFNERLKEDLALIVSKSGPGPGPGGASIDTRDQMNPNSSGLNTSGNGNSSNSNRVSSRLRSRTMRAYNEMSSSTSFTTTVISPLPLHSPSISFSYNLRSTSSNKKSNYNTSSSSSLLIRTLKHSFINSLNNQK